jgi:hypothetical protein
MEATPEEILKQRWPESLGPELTPQVSEGCVRKRTEAAKSTV